MPSDREKLEGESLKQLTDRMQDGPQSGRHYHAPLAELERRKASWERQAAEAQLEAAEAAKETAKYTRRAAFFMCFCLSYISPVGQFVLRSCTSPPLGLALSSP